MFIMFFEFISLPVLVDCRRDSHLVLEPPFPMIMSRQTDPTNNHSGASHTPPRHRRPSPSVRRCSTPCSPAPITRSGLWCAIESEEDEEVEYHDDRLAYAAILWSIQPEMLGRMARKKMAQAAWEAIKIMRVGDARAKEANT
jgi:hypothetical protein